MIAFYFLYKFLLLSLYLLQQKNEYYYLQNIFFLKNKRQQAKQVPAVFLLKSVHNSAFLLLLPMQ